jgi:hypothetical protein
MNESNTIRKEVTPLMVSIPQTCAIINRGTAAVYELLGAGKIKAKKSDGRTLVIYESLIQYMHDLPDAKIAPPRRRKFAQIKAAPPVPKVATPPPQPVKPDKRRRRQPQPVESINP